MKISSSERTCGEEGSTFWNKLSDSFTKTGKRRVANRYAGSCVMCGRTVPAGIGCVEKGSGGAWSVFC